MHALRENPCPGMQLLLLLFFRKVNQGQGEQLQAATSELYRSVKVREVTVSVD